MSVDECCTGNKVDKSLSIGHVPCNILLQVLSLRQEKAKLLGFNSFAELSMSKKVGAPGKCICK